MRVSAPASPSLSSTHSAHARKPPSSPSRAEIEGIRRNSLSSSSRASFDRSILLRASKESSVRFEGRLASRWPGAILVPHPGLLLYWGRRSPLGKRPDHEPEGPPERPGERGGRLPERRADQRTGADDLRDGLRIHGGGQ